tara:strand:+ start:1469 stop:1645 length:177 start_codon:yes stop_codon:yes gene_type:complete
MSKFLIMHNQLNSIINRHGMPEKIVAQGKELLNSLDTSYGRKTAKIFIKLWINKYIQK